MINFLSSWAEQIIIAIVISSILEMILPDNNNKKYIKMVIGVYVLFNIISPIVNKKNLFSLENSFDFKSYAATIDDEKMQETEKVNQKSMDERLEQLYIEELENNIKNRVKQEGYDVVSCKVDAVLYGDAEKQEIKKIYLVVSKKENESDDISNNNNESIKEKSNVQSINKVEINVGLNKILQESNNKEKSEQGQTDSIEIKKLRNSLSAYYEIDSNIINISIK